jgi:hypothetical protein
LPYRWVDPIISGPGVTGHWGYDNFTKNPDNKGGSDYCAVANWQMRFGTPSTWGYDDVPCTDTHQFICKVNSEQRTGWPLICCSSCRGWCT